MHKPNKMIVYILSVTDVFSWLCILHKQACEMQSSCSKCSMRQTIDKAQKPQFWCSLILLKYIIICFSFLMRCLLSLIEMGFVHYYYKIKLHLISKSIPLKFKKFGSKIFNNGENRAAGKLGFISSLLTSSPTWAFKVNIWTETSKEPLWV